MISKDKAKYLAMEFKFRIEEHFQPKTWDEVELYNKLYKQASIDCAMLAVEEILQFIEDNFADPGSWGYWPDVLKEIENLNQK